MIKLTNFKRICFIFCSCIFLSGFIITPDEVRPIFDSGEKGKKFWKAEIIYPAIGSNTINFKNNEDKVIFSYRAAASQTSKPFYLVKKDEKSFLDGVWSVGMLRKIVRAIDPISQSVHTVADCYHSVQIKAENNQISFFCDKDNDSKSTKVHWPKLEKKN